MHCYAQNEKNMHIFCNFRLALLIKIAGGQNNQDSNGKFSNNNNETIKTSKRHTEKYFENYFCLLHLLK